MPPGAGNGTVVPGIALAALKQLVRDRLGCTCPEAVFERVEVLQSDTCLAGLPGDCLLAIGNRLLLLVIGSCGWQQVLQQLEPLSRRGRELRDRHGYNRFRLVVGTGQVAAAEAALRERWRTLPDQDDRLHLHVIDRAALAGLGCAGLDTGP